MNLADTDAYSTPRKIIVGTMKEKEIFLYKFCSEPNAGAVMCWFPVYAYMTEPTTLKTTISAMVQTQRALGKSLVRNALAWVHFVDGVRGE